MSEFEVEPIPGLPALLPDGEELLWQGTPLWVPLAKRAFHVREVGIYFGVLILLRAGFILSDGDGWDVVLGSALWLVFVGLVTVAILSMLAWFYARSTIYSISSKRVIFRHGVVVPIAVNLPFKSIESAGLRVHSDGSGDIPLALIAKQKVSYLLMWPNVRPWHFSKAQPMLRAIPDVEDVAELLADALKAEAEAVPSDVAPHHPNSASPESGSTSGAETASADPLATSSSS
ncbi:photosynthetic complex putative assembly protein PuhB [Thiorhodovibrio frisius]|uniref:Uncharacterized protein n=1 Tax=Thiorhodovibrio frisius TaxID=631362 RepID=H8Z0X4_9GAMM|nr:photosynthetic complex putative assembly protein PuhB [Thiorhodovibrio frisius]EIC21356.1 hypothetical protein Thi970DRAFT_01562 [Thiorhodovibrio frisius]WPL23941.1 PH domain-containing protein [Thiorhodovibrio frisius]